MGSGELWTDDELRVSVESYLFLLRLERAGLNFPMERLEHLLQGALQRRNGVSVRFRLRNISDVLAKTKRPFLAAYPPAENVGTGVRQRIEKMIQEGGDSFGVLPSPPETASSARSQADQALSDLHAALNLLATPKHGMGHNNPPEALDPASEVPELERAISVVEALREELAAERGQSDAVNRGAIELAATGTTWKAWLAARGTKAVDVAIGAAVLALVVLVINAIIALIHLMAHL
jgi:hypothetical protein